VSIAPQLLAAYTKINDAQRAIVAHTDGPLLVIAGPGSGKTFSLVLRTMNILHRGLAKPRELVICTFTEKAAFELRDRISAAAQKTSYKEDLSELRVSTIHGLCNQLLTQHRHRTPLGNNYETLDELTQLLFIFDNFEEIVGEGANGKFLERWTTKWTAIEGARDYFNKITEELVDANSLTKSPDPFLRAIGTAYKAYTKALAEKNRVDFAHLQKFLHDLLHDPQICTSITRQIKFVMVDEYQDTNYIQEQILLKLTEANRNLCVVGDEDQSLYRFRGATVRNILEFTAQVPGTKVEKLITNYRSHKRIVAAYDAWMASSDWSNPDGLPFRYDKTISPDPTAKHPNYPAVFCIYAKTEKDEADRFASLIEFLRQSGVIEDYGQVALLLHSVRQDHSGHFLAALEAKGIPAFCPRARAYFDNDEVRLMAACLALIFGYHGAGRGNITGGSLADLAAYVDSCLQDLAKQYASTPIAAELRKFVAQIAGLKEGESLDLRPADYFFRLLAFDPFKSFVKNENKARNLAVLSQLLNTFQNYYHYTVVTFKNREYLRFHLFNSFFRLLHEGGINEYEDPEHPFPKGQVQVMTIHQSKGLEFPVVVVGSLDKQLSTSKQVDRHLQPFYARDAFEPEDRITHFDRMRLHYVAFSRPEKLLVLTCHSCPKDHFTEIWDGLPQWPYIQKDLIAAQSFTLKNRMSPKRSFSFTGDLKLYETCPRQYQFFREYDFTPSRSAVIFFGLLVHQTIEEIHRIALDKQLHTINQERIRELFEKTFKFLCLADVRPIGQTAKDSAFRQVMNYFRQNQAEMERVIETEVDVSLEKPDYILTGKVDLLMSGDGRLELLDFKTSPKPAASSALLHTYERQLCTYAHILEKRYSKRPERLLLYWTAEESKTDALMQFPFTPALVDAAAHDFDSVVRKIKAKNFTIPTPPEPGICKECDIRPLCISEGIIK
jgi:DNA helicase II / ATP-dependent DNA helicase PcrA